LPRDLLAALWTKLDLALDARPALRALGGRRELGPALGAELATLGPGPALRAVSHGFRGHVNARDQVRGSGLLPHLLLDGRRLRGTPLLVEVRRAVLAQPALGVPAVLGTDPLAAAGALLEVRSRLLHGLVEGGVVLLAPDGALDLVRPCAH